MMNRSEVETAAKAIARKDMAVNGLTATELEAMSWDDKLKATRAIANGYLPAALTLGLPGKHTLLYTETLENTLVEIWNAKVQRLKNARHHWTHMSSGLTVKEATAKVKVLVESFHLRGMRPLDGDHGVSVEVARSWGVEANLYIRFDSNDSERERLVNPDNKDEWVYTYRLRVETSWSSTTRTLAESVASIKLYQELVEVAAEVEAMINREKVVHVHRAPVAVAS